MRIRKNHKNKTDLLTIPHPFEQGLVKIINIHNQKAFNQIVSGQYKKAQENIYIVEKNLRMTNSFSMCFCKLKSMHLNNKANLKMKQAKIDEAIQIIQQAIQFQRKYKLNYIEHARSLFNKAVIFSRVQQPIQYNSHCTIQNSKKNIYAYQQSLRITKQALSLLKDKKYLMNQINQLPKYNQYIILNFCAVAKQLTFLKENQEAVQLYKQGYQLAVKNLGHMHQLTNILKKKNKISKDKAKTQISDISIQHPIEQSTLIDPNQQERKISQSISFQLKNIQSKQKKNIFRKKNPFASLSPYQKYHMKSKRLQSQNIQTFKPFQDEPVQMKQLEKIKKLYQVKRASSKLAKQKSLSMPSKYKASKQISSKKIPLSQDPVLSINDRKKQLLSKLSSKKGKKSQFKIKQISMHDFSHDASVKQPKGCQLI